MSFGKPVPEENIQQVIGELVHTRRGGDKPEEHEKEQGRCLSRRMVAPRACLPLDLDMEDNVQSTARSP